MLRDPRARVSLILPPLIQLFILLVGRGRMEVKNIDLGVVDLDRGPAALEVLQRLRGSPSFRAPDTLSERRGCAQPRGEGGRHRVLVLF